MTMIESTHIPGNDYFSKSQVAELLNIPAPTLQWHIGKEHINTINFPGLGHLITGSEMLRFKEELKKIGQGRPSVYRKVK